MHSPFPLGLAAPLLGLLSLTLSGCPATPAVPDDIDAQLTETLTAAGFTGSIESQLGTKLGRPLRPSLAELGRLLFFDKIQSLHATAEDDSTGNPCAGCHDPAAAFGDSQPIAIGVDSNGVVGPGRDGPRNQRRAPFSVNAVFYPALMWTPRFVALSGDPFDASQGFQFPDAAGGFVSTVETLLMAQAVVAPTELVEMAGFNGTTGALDPAFAVFDDGHGDEVPDPTFDPIQAQVNARVGSIVDYRERFGDEFNDGTPLGADGITTDMRRTAIGEFQATLVAADAPLDRFARGDAEALTPAQKRGALLFFGSAGCVDCHAVAGEANEMFSDFTEHRIGGPQLFPAFGIGTSNMVYDGPGHDEDFGFEQTEGDPALRYTFRTAPLRNLKVAPAYFHNGAFGTIAAAIAHHFDVPAALAAYDPADHGVPADLSEGPSDGILAAGLDERLPAGTLDPADLADLTDFVENGLFDEKVLEYCSLVPDAVPSGMSLPTFTGCAR